MLAHVLPSFDLGGLGSLSLNLIESWPERVKHCALATRYMDTHAALMPAFAELGVQTWEIKRSLYEDPIIYCLGLSHALLRVHPVEAVIAYSLFDFVATGRAVNMARLACPVLGHLPTIPQTGFDATLERIFTAPALQTGYWRYVAPSNAVAQRFTAFHISPAVVWNGVPFDAYPVRWQLRTEGPLRIGFVGRMEPEAKDFNLLIRAVGEAQKHVAVALHLAGDGTQRRELERLASAVCKPGSVKWEGALMPARMPEFLGSLDLFFMAALPIEGMSIALVEAIASGLPVIATDAPANVETLQGTGRLIPCGDVEAGALAIRALADPMARTANALEIQAIRHCFDIRETARRYAELLRV